MLPPAWEILCCWIKLEAGERSGPQDSLAQQKEEVRCDRSELLVFSDVAAMKFLPPRTTMRREDGQTLRESHCVGKTWGGSARERKEQKQDQSPTFSS